MNVEVNSEHSSDEEELNDEDDEPSATSDQIKRKSTATSIGSQLQEKNDH
jgi:hypothetical protein